MLESVTMYYIREYTARVAVKLMGLRRAQPPLTEEMGLAVATEIHPTARVSVYRTAYEKILLPSLNTSLAMSFLKKKVINK